MQKLFLKMGAATRDAYGKALVELGEKHKEIIVLDADLSKSTRSYSFSKKFPDRFINVGICEANMIGIAAGLAACGKLPFISSFASFLICKGYEQIRMGIALTGLNVKLVGSHSGITLGEDGVSQMSIEDIALTTSLPGFTVISPSDEISAYELTMQLGEYSGPVFLRTGRAKTPVVYTNGAGAKIGKALIPRSGSSVAIVACGIEVAESLIAAEMLKEDGIDAAVIDMHTIKPLDEETLEKFARRCGAVVTAEEHQIWGGLGAAVAQALSRRFPVPIEQVAMMDTYAKSGNSDALKEKYGLTAKHIVIAAKKAISRK